MSAISRPAVTSVLLDLAPALTRRCSGHAMSLILDVMTITPRTHCCGRLWVHKISRRQVLNKSTVAIAANYGCFILA
ncbi:hypothetical protein ASPFODRAFT_40677 [Aspergillus luchuensis CBS 106.47]|uniref:Uncharacterized protein n=1 Tax=Aspergillus luchuensis (strain CBS 106.47) TaxID=1137211 RepID=A0A1M3TTY1_ASPLC|nr:hypothetical protein ASPFODRAFT_40677 [Aspergillus luchuensis CBS 106.47]